MNRIRSILGRVVGGPLVVVLLGLGVALPHLEAHERSTVPVIESEHDGTACVVVHDHRICVLGGALRAWLPTPEPHALPELPVLALVSQQAETLLTRLRTTRTRARAPPLG